MREKVKTDGLIQSLPIGISITTPKGKILDVNPTGFKMFGFKTKEEFMENPGQVYWPEQEERDKFFTLLKKGSVINFKVKGKHKDGSELWVSVNSTSKKNEIGEVHFINSFQEITKQKIIEEELHRYESIVSSSNDMIALLDKNYTYLASNNAYVKEFGLNEAEIIGKTVTKVFGKDFFETVIKPRAGKCLKEKKEVNYADWFIFPKSGKKYLNVTYSPYIGNDEILKGFVVIARDISDQRKAEDDLKLKNNAIESSLNAIAIINLDGKLTYVNPSFQKMWKYGNEIHGEPIIKFWKEKGKTVDMIDLVIKNGSWKGELVAEKKDGKLFNVELSANLVRDNDDKPICMMASFVDITDQRNAELEVVRTNENLQNVIDSASEIIISFDNKFNVKTWNKTAEIITGYKKGRLLKNL